jgi:hypothetical protein
MGEARERGLRPEVFVQGRMKMEMAEEDGFEPRYDTLHMVLSIGDHAHSV